MRFSLVPARADDLPDIVAIYNSTIASREVTADLTPVSVQSRQAWFDAHQKPTRPLWVVQTPELPIAGWMSLSDFYGRPAYDHTAEVSIYLHEQARGHGLGRALLREAVRLSPGLGVYSLLGFVFGHNTASVRLFESEGFARWGDLPRVAELDGLERDLVIFGKRIAQPGSIC